jgi:hypothetical protein
MWSHVLSNYKTKIIGTVWCTIMVPESKMAGVFLTQCRVDNVKAILLSQAQSSSQTLVSLLPSSWAALWSICRAESTSVPRGSEPLTLRNAWGEHDDQNEPLFSFDLYFNIGRGHIRHPAHCWGIWGTKSSSPRQAWVLGALLSPWLWPGWRWDLCEYPKRACHWNWKII